MLAMTSKSGPQSAQEASYAWLKKHIGSLPRNEGVFLTEGAIALKAGTSRTPVREALLRLQTEGFLTIVPKKGAYVPPVSYEDVEAVMEARSLVENWCVQRVADRVEGLDVELLDVLAEQKELVTDPLKFIECDRRFHRAIVQSAGNSLVLAFYESLRERQVRMGIRAVTSTEDRARQVLKEHHAIVDAIGASDRDGATAAVSEHLMNTLNILRAPVARRSWVTDKTSKGKPE